MDSEDAAADIVGCEVLNDTTVQVELVNPTEGQLTYSMEITTFDGETVVGDGFVFVSFVRPGERALHRSFADAAGATSCDVSDVERRLDPSTSPVELAECAVSGEGFDGDIEVTFRVDNTTSTRNDYRIEAAIVRDGVRVGIGLLLHRRSESGRPGS